MCVVVVFFSTRLDSTQHSKGCFFSWLVARRVRVARRSSVFVGYKNTFNLTIVFFSSLQSFNFLFNYANWPGARKGNIWCRWKHERIATSWAENLAARSECELTLFMAEISRTHKSEENDDNVGRKKKRNDSLGAPKKTPTFILTQHV